MRYCKHCAKLIADSKKGEELTAHPYCGESIENTDLTEEEIRPLVQKLHKSTNSYVGVRSHGLSMVVIGLTLLIVGLLFFTLAGDGDGGTNTSSSEFFVAVFGTVVGSIVFLVGSIIAIHSAHMDNTIRYHVDQIRANHSTIVTKAPLIFVTWYNHIKVKILKKQHLRRVKKMLAEEGEAKEETEE